MAGQLWILATPTVKLSNMPKNHAVPWLSNWKLCAFRKPTKMQNSCLFISSSIISTNSCCSYSLYIYISYQQIRYHMTSQNAYSHDILLSGWDRGSEVNQPQRTELAGYGFGLPLTRRLVLAMSFWDWLVYLWVPLESQTTNPIQQLTIGWLWPVWYIDLFLGSSIDHLLTKIHTIPRFACTILWWGCLHASFARSRPRSCWDVEPNIRCSWDFLRPWDRSDSDLDPPESWYTFHRNRRPFNYPLQEGKQAKLRWISGEFKKGLGMGQDWSLQVKQMVEMCRQPFFLWGWIFPPSVSARP